VSPVNGFEGEMQVTDSVISTGQVIFTTLIPNSDPCSGGGRSWLMDLDLFSGGRLDTTPFDLNADGAFDSKDYVLLPDGSRVPVSGLQSDVGIGSKPALVSNNGIPACDYLIVAGTNGHTQTVCKNPGPRAVGRQSWRQVR
jgi:type IV pilus assembly protein PilY1